MLYYIRFALIGLVVGVMGFIGFLLSLLSPFNSNILISISWVISRISFWILNTRVEIEDRDMLWDSHPSIYISNHQTILDILVGGYLAPFGAVSLAKKSVAKIPIWGWFYWLSGNILIDRKNKEEAKEILDKACEK